MSGVESNKRIESVKMAKTVEITRNEFFSKNLEYFNDGIKDKSRNTKRATIKKKEFFDMIKNDEKYAKNKRYAEKKNDNRDDYKWSMLQNIALSKALEDWDILAKIRKMQWIWENKTEINPETIDILNRNGIKINEIEEIKKLIPVNINVNNIIKNVNPEELTWLIKQSKKINNTKNKEVVEKTLIQNDLVVKINNLNEQWNKITREISKKNNLSLPEIEVGGQEMKKVLATTKWWEKVTKIFDKIVDEKEKKVAEEKFYQNVYVLQKSLEWVKNQGDIEKLKQIDWFKEYFDNFVEIFEDLWINIKETLKIDIYIIYEQLWSDKLKNLDTKSLQINPFYNKFLWENIWDIKHWKNETQKEKDEKNKTINREYINYSLNCLKSTFDINTDYQWDRNMLNDFRTEWLDGLDFQNINNLNNNWYNLILNGKLNNNDIKLRYNIETWDVYVQQYLWKNENNNNVINKNIDNNYNKSELIKLPSKEDMSKDISSSKLENPKDYFQKRLQEFINGQWNKNNKIFFDKYIEESKAQQTFMNLLWEKNKEDITKDSDEEMFQNYNYIIKSMSEMTSDDLRSFQKNILDLDNVIENIKSKSDESLIKKTIATEIYKKFKWIDRWSMDWINNIFYILKECSSSDANLDDISIKNINIKKLEYIIMDSKKRIEDQTDFWEYPYLSDKRENIIDIDKAKEWSV